MAEDQRRKELETQYQNQMLRPVFSEKDIYDIKHDKLDSVLRVNAEQDPTGASARLLFS